MILNRILIVGNGLIGASVGLALRRAGFQGRITGVDRSPQEGAEAVRLGAVDYAVVSEYEAMTAAIEADVILLAVPVLAVMDWMRRLAPMLAPQQLVTDVGSTKLAIAELAFDLFGATDQPRFLPGHPMAGKESGGAALAQADLFEGAMWLFTPLHEQGERERVWRGWVERMGARTMDLDPGEHDRVCAWVSHLPQMVSTAMSAMFADAFAESPHLAEEFAAIGGRAMREMTRLGASPYSMWRDIAMTNTEPLAGTLFALEQRLAHLRENLKTPELRDEFAKANAFKTKVGS